MFVWNPKPTSYISVRYLATDNHSVCLRKRSSKMESKGNTNAHVLIFGLSFNLILTLGSLSFTCYSLHRLDSRVTAVEQNPPYQFTDSVIVEPTFRNQRSGGSQKEETFRVKRAADRPSMCRKCSSVCLNHRSVSNDVHGSVKFMTESENKLISGQNLLDCNAGLNEFRLFRCWFVILFLYGVDIN